MRYEPAAVFVAGVWWAENRVVIVVIFFALRVCRAPLPCKHTMPLFRGHVKLLFYFFNDFLKSSKRLGSAHGCGQGLPVQSRWVTTWSTSMSSCSISMRTRAAALSTPSKTHTVTFLVQISTEIDVLLVHPRRSGVA